MVDLSQSGLIHMGVNLRGGNGRMPQHLLNGTYISAMCKQMRSEAMPQNVRRHHRSVKSGGGCALFEDLEHSHARELTAKPSKEDVPFGKVSSVERSASRFKISSKRIASRMPERNDAIL